MEDKTLGKLLIIESIIIGALLGVIVFIPIHPCPEPQHMVFDNYNDCVNKIEAGINVKPSIEAICDMCVYGNPKIDLSIIMYNTTNKSQRWEVS